MPHLRTVDKGAFLLLREGVTSPMRANIWLTFTPKITKIQELSPQIHLKPMPLKKTIQPSPKQNSWIHLMVLYTTDNFFLYIPH